MKALVRIAGACLAMALSACAGASDPALPRESAITAPWGTRQPTPPLGIPGIDRLRPFRSQRAPGFRGLRRSRTTASAETLIYSFAGGSDGAVPANDELLPVNGTFYGVTRGGGGSGCGGGGCGTIFKVTPSGGESILYQIFKTAPTADTPKVG